MIDAEWLAFAVICLGPMALAIAASRLAKGRAIGIVGLLGAFVLTIGVLRNAPLARLAAIQEDAHATSPEPPPAAPGPTAISAGSDEQLRAVRAQKAKVEEELTAARAELESVRAELAKRPVAMPASGEAARTRVAEDSSADWQPKLRAAETERLAANTRADAAESKLVLAEATIARLEAARAGAREVSAPEPISPAPFSRTPAQATPKATAPAAAKGPDTGAERTVPPPSAAAAWRQQLATGINAPAMMLEPVQDDELVSGQHGGYYRVACRAASDGQRLEFDAGHYTIAGGDGALSGCLAALRDLVLAALPATTPHKLYARGFATSQGFARPQKMPPADAYLRSVEYLPLAHGGARYVGRLARQAVPANGFTNTELPLLRAARVASAIEKASQGKLKPVVLQGEVKASNDPAAKTFDLILYVGS